jgi:shikimate kinase
MRIFLIGMPGSGKSYWMRNLAQYFHYESLDLDGYIEAMEQQTIPELFEKGESYFREKEQQALRNVVPAFSENIIVATGGGVPFFYDNMEWMKANGRVVYLKAGVPLLFKHLKNAHLQRPLLQSETETEMLEKLTALFEQRKEIYQQAHHVIDIEAATLATFVDTLHL